MIGLNFSPKDPEQQAYLFSSLLSNIVLHVGPYQDSAIKNSSGLQRKQNGIYRQHSQCSPTEFRQKNPLGVIDEFSKIEVYRINCIYQLLFSFTAVADRHDVMDTKEFIFIASLLVHLFLYWIYNFYNLNHLVDITVPHLISKPKQNENISYLMLTVQKAYLFLLNQ